MIFNGVNRACRTGLFVVALTRAQGDMHSFTWSSIINGYVRRPVQPSKAQACVEYR